MKISSGLFSVVCIVIVVPSILLIYSMNYETARSVDLWFTILAGIIDILAIIMWFWIYRKILVPLDKMRIAIKKIADGDFDYELDEKDFVEIPFLYNDFEKMRIKLKENEEEKILSENAARELVSNISHDLKTPLTAIRGYVEGILDGVASSPQKVRDYLNTIYNKTNDMTKLIDELLYYSRVTGNKVSYNFERTNVKDFFDEYVKDLYLELETVKIKFSYTANVDADTVIDIDREQIKRALNNIIANAVKYMDKEKPEIHLIVKEMVDAINIRISDGGSGIGLSIVKKVIEIHEGSVVAMSKSGVGTDIDIVLKK